MRAEAETLAHESPAGASARERRIVFALAFAGMVASFTQTLLIPIQSALPRLLDTDLSSASWAVTVTLLAGAASAPISGKLGDVYGRRTTLICLISLLTAGSALCALSSYLPAVILGRGLQGVGLGVIPLGISLLKEHLTPQSLPSAVALISATLGAGGALGLPASAAIVQYLDWHFIFLPAIMLGIIALLIILKSVPRTRTLERAKFDFVGSLGLSIGLSLLFLAISSLSSSSQDILKTIVLVISAVLVMVLWAGIELRVADPLVDLRVNLAPTVLLTNVASLALGFSLFASNIVFPQILQAPVSGGGLGMNLLPSSFLLMTAGVVMLCVAPLAGFLHRRLGPKVVLILGGFIIAGSYAMASLTSLSFATVFLINVGIGIGTGFGYAAMPSLILMAVPPHASGAANGVNTLVRSVGTSAAAAIIALVLANNTRDGIPAPAAFQMAFLLSLGVALIGIIAAVFVPVRGRR